MQQTITLNDDNLMPLVGLGTWKSEPNKVGEAVKYAVMEAGYKHIDGASIYRNEPEVGLVYKEIFSTVKREDIFITSKLWNTSHDPLHVEEACRTTLKNLQLDYLDLYLMHWGIAFKHGEDLEPMADGKVLTENISVRETWEAMEKLVSLGLVKSIGVANFNTTMLVDLLTYAKIKPVINQIEVHPYNSQAKLINYCRSKDIVVTAYSPLGRQGAKGVTGPSLFEDPIIKELSVKYQKTPAQILVNWGVMRGTVVIPKSITPSRILENIQVYDFELNSEDMDKIDGLNKNYRYVDPGDWWGIPYFS